MSIFDAIVLGLVQGVTEFIPVSSSGHLVIASSILGVQENFRFGVLLNIGTLIALVMFYRHRVSVIVRDVVERKQWHVFWLLAIATLPVLITGVIFSDFFESMNKRIGVVITSLLVVGFLMVRSGQEKSVRKKRELGLIDNGQAAVVGLAQTVALVPGVSRSGITILAGLRQGFNARLAAEFSFMLAIPTISAAVLKVLVFDDGFAYVFQHPMIFIVGNLVSFLAGSAAIKFFIRLLEEKGLRPFGWYRIGLAVLLIFLTSVNIVR